MRDVTSSQRVGRQLPKSASIGSPDALTEIGMVLTLTPTQQAYVDQVPFKEVRPALAEFLASGVEVVIGRQHEVPEAPPFAITVHGTEFWIGCCASADEASALAESLGLRVLTDAEITRPRGSFFRPVPQT